MIKKIDVLMIIMKHGNSISNIEIKPDAIINCNRMKGFIDLCDGLVSYNTCLLKSVKWYRKIAVDILCSTTLVITFSLYKRVNNKNISTVQEKYCPM